jgi:hypothetical protein
MDRCLQSFIHVHVLELLMGGEPTSAIPYLWLKSSTLTTRPSRAANVLSKGGFRNIVNNVLSPYKR